MASSEEVYFDLNSTVLDDEALEIIDGIAQDASQSKSYKMTIIGYADRSGSAHYNNKLATRRAQAVVKALKGRGIPSARLHVESCGEEALAIPTHDDVKFRENRRVIIQMQKK